MGSGPGTGATATANIVGGQITSYTVTSGGSGYLPSATITITGGGGSGAHAEAEFNGVGGGVGSIYFISAGSGYTGTPSLVFSGGGGSGASALGLLDYTTVDSVMVTSAGTGYTSAPTVAFTNGAVYTSEIPATATATLGYSVASATVTLAGTGYTTAPTVGLTGGGGSGATATASTAGVTITGVTVTAPGTGYTSTPTVSFSGGGGSGAAGTVTLTPTSIASLAVTAAGSGYTSAPAVSISGGSGTGATGAATLTTAAVDSLSLTAGGVGYTSAPTLSFTGGGGSGAAGTAGVGTSSVLSVTITAAGTGYTSAPTVSFSGGGGSGAAAVAPAGGVITLVSASVKKDSGYDVYDYTWARGIGEVSRETETRLSGMLQRITMRYLTAITVATQPTIDPLSGGSIINESRNDQDGYRLWAVTWIKAITTSFIVNSTTKRNNGKLVVYRREQFGSAPTAPSATISGTVVETDSSERLEDGYTVYVKEWAEGVGTITNDVQQRHNGKLVVYHKVALGAAPTTPTATISGTVTLTQDDSREESGVIIYDRTWAEGVGVITTRQRPVEGFLRPVLADVLAAPATNLAAVLAFSGIPVGTLVDYSTDQLDGVARWALLFMAEADGTAIVSGATQGTFQKYEGFVYPGRAKYYTQTVSMPPASSVTGTIHDVYLSPPEETKVLATHTISYQTTATVGALANTLWNPTESATINAKWTATNFTNYFPRSKVEGLRGYRAVNAGSSGTTSGSDWTSSVFGDTMPAGATWAIALSGGPADPAGSTWTLHAEAEPAFYDLVNNVQWYRLTVISATPAAQTALPV